MHTDERGGASGGWGRFRLRQVLSLLTVVAVGLGVAVSFARIAGENARLRGVVADHASRIADLESLLTGRPYRFQTEGLVSLPDGQIVPRRLAPADGLVRQPFLKRPEASGVGVPEGVDRAMQMDASATRRY